MINMSNICDYIKWRGDLSFEADPINEIDNLILSRISYLPFKEIKFNNKEKFKILANRFLELKKEDFHQIDDISLIEELAKSNRYKDLIFSDYYEKIDEEEEKQFAAVTIWLQNNELFVSYRGTDATIVGWKEDFNMSFMINVPSQLEGVKYLEAISKKYFRKKILILTYLGHQTLGIYVIHMALIFYVIRYCNSFFSIDNSYLEYALITIITLIVTQIINIILMLNKWSRLIFLGNLK